MPLTKGQLAALEIIGPARSPTSFVAGSTPLNISAPRFSADIDIFHDRADDLLASAERDIVSPERMGFVIEWIRRADSVHSAYTSRDGERFKIEWVFDSDFRYFPTIPDPVFGQILHPLDLAANKAQAAAGRRAVRDIVDLLTTHESVLPTALIERYRRPA